MSPDFTEEEILVEMQNGRGTRPLCIEDALWHCDTLRDLLDCVSDWGRAYGFDSGIYISFATPEAELYVPVPEAEQRRKAIERLTAARRRDLQFDIDAKRARKQALADASAEELRAALEAKGA